MKGLTCIDCHQGIAHNLPEGYLEEYKRVVEELEGAPPSESAVSQGGILGGIDAMRKYLARTEQD